ncbi:MAG: hypothetical protein REH79_01110 [Spiroplasma sp.]|nr:hypothetical protein [Spiroplasma sp.]
MKKLLSLIITSSLVLNVSTTSIVLLDKSLQIRKNNLQQPNHNLELAQEYAKATSIIPKALLIGREKGLNTANLLNDMNQKLVKSTISSDLSKIKTANDFIDNLTTNLDLDSINNIQSHYQRNGINQNQINNIKKMIINYQSYPSLVNVVKSYFTNINLSNPEIIKIVENILPSIKTNNSKIITSLSLVSDYLKPISVLLNEVITDWDQESDYGTTPLAAMKNYIASDKGNIAQAKNIGTKGQWHYVAVRAKNWTWNDFYQYIAGANLNYMIKKLSGNYLGELINNHLDAGPFKWGFDQKAFINDLSSAINKLPETLEAWPYLMKAIVPFIKSKILKLENPTLGVKNLTWNKTTGQQDLLLRNLLIELQHLLSPEGQKDLVKLLTSVLTGPFGEDITINMYTLGYYTLPELIDLVNTPPISWIIGAGLKPEVLAEQIANSISDVTKKFKLDETLTQITNFADKYLIDNPVIDLQQLATTFNQLFANDIFVSGLKRLIALINDAKTPDDSLEAILVNWGLQKGETEFKPGSILAIIKNLFDDRNSILNQVLKIFFEKNNGIIANIVKEQQELLEQQYYRFFDISNEQYFLLRNINLEQQSTTMRLSYKLFDQITKKSYLVALIKNANGQFLLTDFHIMNGST